MKNGIFVTYSAMELCPELGRIMAESFRSAFADFISRETLDRCAVAENCAALVRGIQADGGMVVQTGWLDGKLMGLMIYSEHRGGWMEIEALHTLPESWGTGLGAAMLEFALEETNAWVGVGLWAFEENRRARRFYEKHGFVPTGERRISEFDGAVELRYQREGTQWTD